MSADQSKYLLTPEALEKLKEQIKELEEKIIPEYARLLEEARADGDLRENEPFQIMKDKLADAKLRLAELKDMLKNAKIVKGKDQNTVNLGDTIEIEIDGVNKIISIVSEIEASPADNKFSASTPIGEAVLGRKIGETVALPTGKQIKILRKAN